MTHSAQPPAAPSSAPRTGFPQPQGPEFTGNPWPALWAMVLGFFMILADSTIVSIATPTLMRSGSSRRCSSKRRDTDETHPPTPLLFERQTSDGAT